MSHDHLADRYFGGSDGQSAGIASLAHFPFALFKVLDVLF